MTYLLMGLPFIFLVLILDLFILKTKVLFYKKTWVLMLAMILITAIFDQILTGLPIVTYDQSKNLGIKFFYMPIEDFLYTIAAVIGLSSLSKFYEQRRS